MGADSLQTYISSAEGASLVAFCEDCELQAIPIPEEVTMADIYICLLLQLLAENKITRAEIAAQRATRGLSAHQVTAEVTAVLQLVKAIASRDYAAINAAFSTLSTQLRPVFSELERRLCVRYRQQQLALIAEAYVQVRVPNTAVLLGTSVEENKQAQTLGWTYDAATDILFPVTASPAVQPVAASDIKEQLKQLSEYVVHLEI
ncbi:hypothetical protein, variant [Sphaeroforma arctica JP610]|uniref:CSN8/PSMD8/EIF3K domain-containing protein n=1 Tax=Sphaeroforma arctica JP610 TaxID=667725 RepID=A0A0L0GGN8_9EUKA|nr:hypothetical protein, variant [Sphaeroforma arctica JP610]KNC87498.1 hypothetical protein, variant [Sphaeroforma arctica JP610]|eukprot:XP_014161400.1 hypothetical protein, variant [Sphaeroforma arctica JP610]